MYTRVNASLTMELSSGSGMGSLLGAISAIRLSFVWMAGLTFAYPADLALKYQLTSLVHH